MVTILFTKILCDTCIFLNFSLITGYTKLWNYPEPPRITQNEPELARTSQNWPEPTRTGQNQPEPARNNQNKERTRHYFYIGCLAFKRGRKLAY